MRLEEFMPYTLQYAILTKEKLFIGDLWLKGIIC